MPLKNEWVTVNAVSAIFLVKDWIFNAVGIDVEALNALDVGIGVTSGDIVLKWLIGMSIFAFNIVKIIKYIKDIKSSKK